MLSSTDDSHLSIETRVKVLSQWFGGWNKHYAFVALKAPNNSRCVQEYREKMIRWFRIQASVADVYDHLDGL